MRAYAVITVSLLLAACSGTDEPLESERDAGFVANRDGGTTFVRDAGPGPDGSVRDAGSVPGNRWEPGPPIPEGPRQETGVVALRGEVYVIGGYGSAGFGPLVEAYNPATDTWRRVADFPVDMHHPNAVAYDDRIYVLGFLVQGFQDDGRVFVYDPDRDVWEPRTAMPANRARGSSVVAESDGLLYVVGGLKNVVPTSDFDVYDPALDEWRPLPPIPRAMDHGVGGAYQGRVYVAGGRAGGITSHTPRLDVFEIGTSTWSEGPSMPTGRAGTAGVFLDGRLYVFGGEGNTQNPPTNLFEEVEAFDVAMQTWITLAPMDPAIHGTGAAAIQNRIYVPGGATVQAFGAVDTMSVYIP